MVSSNYQYIDLTGQIVPDTGDLLQIVQDEFKAAFGADIIVTPDTPQGKLITAEVLARTAVLQNNAILANQINPNLAGGIFLDAIWALTGGQRDVEKFSRVQVNLAGVVGTVIPTDVTIKDPAGIEFFKNTAIVTLDSLGGAIATFQAVDPGPITALAGTLTEIVSGVLGLETVTNPSDAVIGVETQSDMGSRAERQETLALQSMSLSEAITSGLLKIQGVSSLTYRENKTNTSFTVDGITLVPNSIYVCVDGGIDLDIATILQQKKTGGTNYNNGFGTPVTVNVTDPISHQVIAVKFDRPTLIPVVCKVVVKQGNSPIDAQTAVKQAILDYVNGLLDQESGFKVGVSVSSFELAGAVNVEYPSLYVKDLQIALASDNIYQYGEIPITVYQKATISISSIQVTVI